MRKNKNYQKEKEKKENHKRAVSWASWQCIHPLALSGSILLWGMYLSITQLFLQTYGVPCKCLPCSSMSDSTIPSSLISPNELERAGLDVWLFCCPCTITKICTIKVQTDYNPCFLDSLVFPCYSWFFGCSARWWGGPRSDSGFNNIQMHAIRRGFVKRRSWNGFLIFNF